MSRTDFSISKITNSVQILAGIYIHIPFCKQACYYCNFHYSTSIKQKDALIDAIIEEIDRRAPAWRTFQFDTIYFGGGTPSLLPVGDIAKILNKIYQTFSISVDSEITLEGNPDDLTSNKLKEIKSLGINRLSIGVQSFYDEDLQKLNRSHKAIQAEQVIESAQNTGFDNITIDLMYGIPGLTDKKLCSNIQKVLNYQIPHISAYALTVEPQTVLAWQIKKQIFPPVSDEQSARQFYLLSEMLSTRAYGHYEISNFAKKNYVSQHNSHYWNNVPYLGLGPAAHSYKTRQRRWNIANNALYIKKLKTDNYYEQEVLSRRDIYNELLMTGLRTAKGVNLNDIKGLGEKYFEYLQRQIDKYVENKQLIIESNHLKPHPAHWFVIEGIIRDLFMV